MDTSRHPNYRELFTSTTSTLSSLIVNEYHSIVNYGSRFIYPELGMMMVTAVDVTSG